MIRTAGARRRITSVAFAVALALGIALAAVAGGVLIGTAPAAADRPAAVRPPAVAASASASAGPSGPPSALPGDNRVGGSPPGPARGKPGWVWFAAAALVVVLGMGGFQLWRSRELDEPGPADPED